MTQVSSIALSGLRAASTRLQASASNIANTGSRGAPSGAAGPDAYRPLQTQLRACASGGVAAALSPSSREALLTYDPSAPFANAQGYVATPDIDLAEEMVQLVTARHSFAASLQVLRTAGEMDDDVLGIII